MRIKRRFQVGGLLLAALALCMLFYTPTMVAAQATHASRASAATTINANVYLTGKMLQPLFQSNLDAQLPRLLNNAIADMVNTMPQQDQSWGAQMANALLQPSAKLVSLTPQATGLLATLKLSLYPGDPKPVTTSLLIGFKVSDASTIQVTALPSANGSQSLLNGPLTTFHMPIGSLNSVATTPHCGESDLNINLKLPVALNQQNSASGQSQPATASHGNARTALTSFIAPAPEVSSYIEIPAAALAQLGSGVGSLPVSSSLTASNIRLGTQGSSLTLTSDIAWHGLGIGTAVSTLAPGASNGNLVVHALHTDLKILGGLITFPINSYNQQIEQIMNTKLNSALAGKFTVAQATSGANPALPCADPHSLILAGTLTLA